MKNIIDRNFYDKYVKHVTISNPKISIRPLSDEQKDSLIKELGNLYKINLEMEEVNNKYRKGKVVYERNII